MVIHFSGGKDSLVVLHKYKDDPSLEAVMFGDTGAVYPHMIQFIREICEKWNVPLVMVKPERDIHAYQEEHGLPSDMVPTTRSPEFAHVAKGNKQKIQSHIQCCGNMLWKPLYFASLKTKDKIVYRGIKNSDEHGTLPSGTVDENGVTWVNPIWDWSDADVFKYLADNNIEMPKHYKDVNASFDCWLCTAHIHSPTDKDRLVWTKKNYPSYWRPIMNRFKKLRQAINEEMAVLDKSIDFVLNRGNE